MYARRHDSCIVLLQSAFDFVFDPTSIGGAMRFSDDRHSDKGFASVAVPPIPLAVRFARFALAAVLAASFMPVAAFADEGEPAGPEGVQDQPAQTEQAQQGDPAAVDG